MRVSSKMFFEQMRSGIVKAQNRAYETQKRASSGIRVNRAADDPVAAARAMLFDASLAELDSMDRTSERARYELTIGEGALGQAGDQMQRVRELTIQALDGISYINVRQSLAREVEQLRDELRSIANTDAGGVYLFAGFATGTEPILADGTFAGTPGVRQAEVAPGVTVDLNVSGEIVFGTGAGQDLFATLDQLIIDLNADDTAAIQTRLGELDPVFDQLLEGRLRLGERLNAVDAADERRSQTRLQTEQFKAEAIGIDPAASYLDLSKAQFSLQAAITQASKILQGLNNTLF